MASSPPSCHLSRENAPTDTQIEEEMCVLDLEDADSLLEHVQDLVAQSMDDFPEDDDAARYAAKMTKASITDGTRTGHLRYFISYFTPIVAEQRDTVSFDTILPCIFAGMEDGIPSVSTSKLLGISRHLSHKSVGLLKKGLKGESRAALKMWYRSIRPNEILTEWRFDSVTNTWRGLPTRSRHVSQFMVGLEKTKAKSGEVSSSARALALEDIHRLYDHCMNPDLSIPQRRLGIVRYVAYLLA
ncbi:hypothetical protein DFH09DRAFT_1109083 [Mycena vulgaris]|nr:hypothetical protein DFH09DRAFT_1109083 [Mycena vulgaris]